MMKMPCYIETRLRIAYHDEQVPNEGQPDWGTWLAGQHVPTKIWGDPCLSLLVERWLDMDRRDEQGQPVSYATWLRGQGILLRQDPDLYPPSGRSSSECTARDPAILSSFGMQQWLEDATPRPEPEQRFSRIVPIDSGPRHVPSRAARKPQRRRDKTARPILTHGRVRLAISASTAGGQDGPSTAKPYRT